MNIFNRLFKTQPTKTTTPPQAAPSPTRKTCSRCKGSLPVEAFYRKASSPDGLQYWCKQCTVSSDTLITKRKKKGKRFVLKTPLNNLQKKTLQLNIPNVTQAQYRQLVDLAKVRKCTMTELYAQMLNDFLTLHSK